MWCSTPSSAPGTTGAVARTLHRHWIGVEREPAYVDLARDRIAAVQPTLMPDSLFTGSNPRREARVPFGALLEQGLLQPGQALYLGKAGPAATVLADGTLEADGERGSIDAVGRRLAGLPSCNGWEAWYYEDRASGERRVLDTLRRQARLASATPVRLAAGSRSVATSCQTRGIRGRRRIPGLGPAATRIKAAATANPRAGRDV